MTKINDIKVGDRIKATVTHHSMIGYIKDTVMPVIETHKAYIVVACGNSMTNKWLLDQRAFDHGDVILDNK